MSITNKQLAESYPSLMEIVNTAPTSERRAALCYVLRIVLNGKTSKKREKLFRHFEKHLSQKLKPYVERMREAWLDISDFDDRIAPGSK